MKLRIHGDTLRLRLTRAEVRRVAEGERVEEVTWFSAETRLMSGVCVSAGDGKISAKFVGDTVAVALPEDLVKSWAASEEVGIEGVQDAGGGRVLRILVEKDFECLHTTGEDQADRFKNPRR